MLVEVEGGPRRGRRHRADIIELARARGAFEARRTHDPEERKRLWAGRKGAFGAMGRIAPDLYVADVVVAANPAARDRRRWRPRLRASAA